MWGIVYEWVTGVGYALIWLFIIGVAMYGALLDSKKDRRTRR